jgi:putative two-component system response regulator
MNEPAAAGKSLEARAKILIIDDNPANVMLLERMLKISGYRNIATTTDSRLAVEMYQSLKPDLVMLDLQMPYYDGFEILEQLNKVKHGDYLSVIVITAQNDKENLLKALNLGVKDFFGKPFDTNEVVMRIRNMLEIRMLHNQICEQNQRLEEKVVERTRELGQLQMEFIERLLRAAEFRDNDTGLHIKRIGLYASAIAKAAGLPEEFCKCIEYASMMHDIGKIGISDEILLKPGKLDADEWVKMKTHTYKGAQILSGSSDEVLKLAEEIALTHHEKWDGSGYPEGIQGEKIPISGRITAICDVFDALVSKRPYKEAWDVEAAVAEIQKGKGFHFDPHLVDVFIQCFPRIMEIKERFEE